MTYILLAAGKGTRLYPITFSYPKCLYKLDENTTAIQRMVQLIRKYDNEAEIVIVTGFMEDTIKNDIGDSVIYIHNPFYSLTNSIASLWFAKEYLQRDQVTIINADTVMSERAVKEVLCRKHEKPTILLDSSIRIDGDYNVEVDGDLVVVMSKNLKKYYGEFGGVTILDRKTCEEMTLVLEEMIREEQFNEWYEDVIVRMIFRNNSEFYFFDLHEYEWTEIDTVDDLIKAKKIHAAKK